MITLTRPTYQLKDNSQLLHAVPGQYVLRVKDLDEQDRPREKMQAAGPASLSVSELLAIVWGTGSRKEEVLSMAQRTLQDYGEKSIAAETNPEKLAFLADIPVGKAAQVVASLELGRRFFLQQRGRAASVRNAQQAFAYLKEIGYGKKEQLRGLYLNSRYEVVHDEVISVGTLTSNVIHPREIFQPALEHGAVAIIIAHNHPSGSLQPTAADIEVTEQLIAAGKLLGIDLLDHLIIASGKHVSVLAVAAV